VPERLYLIYRSVIIDGGIDSELYFARSTDGGATWSQPVRVGQTNLPDEMTSASVIAAPNDLVHVAWVATGSTGGRVEHRRHLQGGDPAQAFEPAAEIVGAQVDASGVRLVAGNTPHVLATYQAGDGTLRGAWSPDAGASFPAAAVILVAAAESPDQHEIAAEGEESADLVYRSAGSSLIHRAIRLADPAALSMPSSVSDEGEPASSLALTLRSGEGPAAIWLKTEGDLRRPFVDAVWFNPISVSDQPVPGAARAVVRAAPNPFRSRTAIDLELAAPAPRMRLAVYSASGRLARVVHDGPLPAGAARFLWDGRDAHGKALAAGVYYLTATLPQGSVRTRAVLLRCPETLSRAFRRLSLHRLA
jgi:hypothetical protein